MQEVKRGVRSYPTAFGLAVLHLGALGIFVPALFSWSGVAVAVALYFITGFGITLGYHRLLTHRSLAMPRPLEYFVTVLAVLAVQGGPIDWVATHRAHHAHTDRDGDPHDVNRGMPWAHMEWLFRTNKDRVQPHQRSRWAPDLSADPFYRFLDDNYIWVTVALGAVLLLLGGWSWVVWGIFARTVFTYHCTWAVNSASHGWGYQTFRTGDRSTNNWWVALLAFGEGWHNNHHAFPFSAAHGLRWFEIDPTYGIIRVLRALRLARSVKIPTNEMMDRLRLPKPSRLGRAA